MDSDRDPTTLAPEELRGYLEQADPKDIQAFCESGHTAALAEALSALEADQAWEALKRVPPTPRAEIFCRLDESLQVDITEKLSRGDLARLLSDMPADDRVDLLRRLPEEESERVLPAMAQAEREDVRRLSSYAEGTAGSIMTSEYVTLRPELTAEEAIARLRREAPNKETIYHAYILGEDRRLVGVISLKDLIVARASERVGDLMHREVIRARATDDQEAAARMLQRYDLLALPVVDEREAIVGIITHDDAIDVITQENTEDFEKLMAITGAHETGHYLRTPAWVHFRNRVGWVVSLAVVGLLSGTIIQRYESSLERLLILALFMPMLADTGGNTGSQAATVVVRALALGQVKARDIFRVLFKEAGVALMLCGILGLTSFGRVMLLSRAEQVPEEFTLWMVGLTIAVALSLQVVSATLLGALLPMLAARLKLDPALVASPALTTAVDITGLLIYFNTARVMLGL